MRKFPVFLLLLLCFPLLELYLLIKVGTLIGALPTVLLVVSTAALGLWLARHQGFQNYRQMQACLARGEIPAREMLEGIILFTGGVLLLLPGLISDFLGLLCLIPPIRSTIVTAWLRRVTYRVIRPDFHGDGNIYDMDNRHLPPGDNDPWKR